VIAVSKRKPEPHVFLVNARYYPVDATESHEMVSQAREQKIPSMAFGST
jgi:hypothetical protein